MNDAKPLTPEEQAVLDGLAPSVHVLCSVAKEDVPHDAEVALRCRSCGVAMDVVCKHHARGFAARCTRDAMVCALKGETWIITCLACHRAERTIDALIEVVTL